MSEAAQSCCTLSDSCPTALLRATGVTNSSAPAWCSPGATGARREISLAQEESSNARPAMSCDLIQKGLRLAWYHRVAVQLLALQGAQRRGASVAVVAMRSRHAAVTATSACTRVGTTASAGQKVGAYRRLGRRGRL